MSQQTVCPHCSTRVGKDKLCATCGLVEPVIVQAPDPRSAGGRGGAPQLTARQAAEQASPFLPLIVLGMVGVLIAGYFAIDAQFARKTVKDKDASWEEPEPGDGPVVKKGSPTDLLIEVAEKIRSQGYEDALKLVARLRKRQKSSQSLAKLKFIVEALQVETDDLTSTFKAIDYLAGRSDVNLRRCATRAREILDLRMARRLEAAGALVDTGKLEEALALYKTIAEGSTHAGEAKLRIKDVSHRLCPAWATQAQAKLRGGDPAEADRLIQLAIAAAGPREFEGYKAIEANIENALEAKATLAYHEGKAKEALALIDSRRHKRFEALWLRITQVTELVQKAQTLESKGILDQAKAEWKKVVRREPHAANHYRKLAERGLR